jgi:hypothetical protein
MIGMDKATDTLRLAPTEAVSGAEQRGAPRFTLLIRAAKLVSAQGEFVCVVRDVSETGFSVRLFHRLPDGKAYTLHMPGGAIHDLVCVWQRGREAGFALAQPVGVTTLIAESGEYPKRSLRLMLRFPVTITTYEGRLQATVENLSQQGARLNCDRLLAIDQTVRIDMPDLSGTPRGIRAKVRWRRDLAYGVVFEDTSALGDFARLAAFLQAPALLED